MSEEKILTYNSYNNIFHPLLLKSFDVKNNDYAIIPKYNGSDLIDNYQNFSNENKFPENILSSLEIDNYFTSNNFLLSANLQINSIDDVYLKINDLLISNRKIQTVNFIIEIIFNTFKDKIDDIGIDKLIDFYKK